MSKKGTSLPLETIIIFIIVIVALAFILIILFSQNNSLAGSLKNLIHSTTSLASDSTIQQP